MSEQTPTRTDGPVTDAGARTAEAPEDRRRRRLASYTVRNMVYSTLLVLLLVLAWWSMTYNPAESQRQPPEVTQTATYVVEQAEWPVWVPDPGQGWTPTVVWFDARVEGVTTWHISYTSPAGEYVALEQAADVTQGWVAAMLAGARATGSDVRLPGPVGDQDWQAWQGPDGGDAEVGYLLGPEATGGSTVVVHGTAQQAEFEEFLRSITAR